MTEIPPIDYAKSKLKEQAYHTALGYFVETFARCEKHLYGVLTRYAGLPSSVAAALLSGTKIDTHVQFIRRLYNAGGTEIPPLLQKALTQLSHINRARNLLLHHGTHIWFEADETGSVVEQRALSTINRVLNENDAETFLVDSTMIENMTEDLRCILNFFYCLFPDEWGQWLNCTPSEAAERLQQRTWLYKPPQPEDTGPKSRARTHKRARQPKPSRA